MNPSFFARRFSAVLALSAAIWPNISSAAVIPAPFNSHSTTQNPSVSFVSNFGIANNGAPLGSRVYFGQADLTDNDLIVYATSEAAALANYANIVDMVRSGYDGGDWAGMGITSSTVALDHAEGYGITALGVVLNDDGLGDPIWGGTNSELGSFDGYTAIPGVGNLSIYDVIVKYTYAGDAFNGSVSPADAGYVGSELGTGTGWFGGEFNYTGGTVSPLDVQETNRSLAHESQYPLTVPVPEPAPLVLVGFAMLGLAGCARRRRDPDSPIQRLGGKSDASALGRPGWDFTWK